MQWFETTSEGTLLRLRVIPRAAKNEVQGPHGDRLKIRLQAPPVEGKANKALMKFLAGKLEVPVSRLSLVAGKTGREKMVRVEGVDAKALRAALWPE